MSATEQKEGEMSRAIAPNGDESHIRAIIFREGVVYIAQCLEYDICAQAPELDAVVSRLELTIEAEFEVCEEKGRLPKDCINPAPNYYFDLWDKRSYAIERVNMASPLAGDLSLEVALGKAA